MTTGDYGAFRFRTRDLNKLKEFCAKHDMPINIDELHCTIIYNRNKFTDETKQKVEELCNTLVDGHIKVKGKAVEIIGKEDNHLVLCLESKELQDIFNAIKDCGATWDFESYKPHVTVYKLEDGQKWVSDIVKEKMIEVNESPDIQMEFEICDFYLEELDD